MIRGTICTLVLVSGFVLSGCATQNSRSTEGQNGNPAAINVRLAKAYIRDGQYEQAMKKLNKALDQNPSFAAAHATIALLYQHLKEYEKADSHYEEAIRLEPKNSGIRNNYGAYLCARGRLEEADEQFTAAAANPLYERAAYALTNAGLCAMKIPDLEKAESYFRAALRRSPRFPVALYQMAEINFRKQHYVAARGYIQRFAEVGDESPASLWLGVRIERNLGNTKDAEAYAARLKSKFPDAEQTQQLLKMERDDRNTGK